MTTHTRDVLLRVVGIIAVSVGGFVLLQKTFRHFEAWASKTTIDVTARGHAFPAGSSSIGVVPLHDTPFTAVISPSCSAIASVLAIVSLAMVTTRVSQLTRLTAAAVAAAVVTVGNILRIATSIGMGIVFGRSSLILFHDWVGGLMTFVYTLGGYTIMLYLMLPRRPRASLADNDIVHEVEEGVPVG